MKLVHQQNSIHQSFAKQFVFETAEIRTVSY